MLLINTRTGITKGHFIDHTKYIGETVLTVSLNIF